MSAKQKARGELSKKLVVHQLAIVRDILEYSIKYTCPDPAQEPEYALIGAYDLLGQFIFNLLGMMHEKAKGITEPLHGPTTRVSGLTGKTDKPEGMAI